MKISIPDRFISNYEGFVYVSRWKKQTIILLNEQKYKNLIKTIDKLKMDELRGIKRFIKAGIVKIGIKNSQIDIPEHFIEFIGSKKIVLLNEGDNVIVKALV